MNLLWTVPVMAAAVGTGLVAARARALEDATVELGIELRRLGELRHRLTGVTAGLRETREQAAELSRRHPVSAPAP